MQTADYRPQTVHCRLQSGLTRKILLTVTSSSTTFPAQNNINLVAKILLDFLWWFDHRNGVRFQVGFALLRLLL